MNTAQNNYNELDFLKQVVGFQDEAFVDFSLNSNLDLTLHFTSPNFLELLGLVGVDNQDIKEFFLTHRLCPVDKQHFDVVFETVMGKKTEESLVFRIKDEQGGYKWISGKAKVFPESEQSTRFLAKISDATKEHTELERLKMSEARCLFANFASGVGVWDWDLTTNKVYYSRESLEILEADKSGDFEIGSPEKWDELVHPDDRLEYYSVIQEHFDGKLPYYETVHRVLCGGRYKWILDRGKVLERDKNNKPTRIIGTHTDVSRQKEKEEILLDTLQKVNSQKNILLNFAHIVSHNLRNHTGNFALILKMRDSGEFADMETFEYLKSVSNELTHTIENLMDLIHVHNETDIKTEEINVQEALSKIVTIISEEISGRNVKIVNYIPKDLLIEYNPAYFESILLNLTTNAIKYSREGIPPVIEYSVEENADFYIVQVKDNGLGIDLNLHRGDVFGLYKTFHPGKEAIGIGLYITKNQVESMGGKIDVESEVGMGSTFKVYFKKKLRKLNN